MKRILLPLLAIFCSFCVFAQGTTSYQKGSQAKPASGTSSASYKDTSGKLYLVSTMRSWGLDLNFVFLGSNGSILYDPTLGVNPPNFSAELKANPANVGKYSLAGNKLNIEWHNGRKDVWDVEHNNGEISYMNGGISTRQKPLPAGYRIAGKFSAGAVMPNVAATNSLTFRKDGTFSMGSLASASPEDAHTAQASSASKGAYTINGNTLTLNFSNGTKQTAVITEMTLGGKPHYIINGESYRKED